MPDLPSTPFLGNAPVKATTSKSPTETVFDSTPVLNGGNTLKDIRLVSDLYTPVKSTTSSNMSSLTLPRDQQSSSSGSEVSNGSQLLKQMVQRLAQKSQHQVDDGCADMPVSSSTSDVQFTDKGETLADVDSRFTGFKFASGGDAFQVSAASLQKARALLEVDENDDCNQAVEPQDHLQDRQMFGFTKARGTKLPPPSEKAQSRASELFSTEDKPISVGFSSASGKKVFAPSESAMLQANRILQSPQSSSSSQSQSKQSQGGFKVPQLPFKRSGQVLNQRHSIAVPTKKKQRILTKQNTRLSLPTQINGKSLQGSRSAFKIPYAKDRPLTQTPVKAVKPKEQLKSVFNMESVVHRLNLSDLQLEHYSSQELVDKFAIPSQYISVFEEKQFESFTFEVDGGARFGWSDAKDQLIAITNSIDMQIDKWVQNHYKLIVQKLLCYVLKFPSIFWVDESKRREWCSPDAVMRQLCYRYEREHLMAHRSSIKIICEQDAPSSYPLVLFVYSVAISADSDQAECLLSDGWYMVNAQLDPVLTRSVKNGKLLSGQKLLVCNAQMINQSEACSPLELSSDSKLRIFANSTRRVAWHTRLGHLRVPPLVIPVRSINSEGGLISYVETFIIRKYPVIYTETLPDGSKVSRNQSEEELYCQTYNAKMQQYFEELRAKSFSYGGQSETELSELRDQIQERFPTRNVRSTMKVRILCSSCFNKDVQVVQQQSHHAQVTIYNPEQIAPSITEGNAYKIYNLMPFLNQSNAAIKSLHSTKMSRFFTSDMQRCDTISAQLPSVQSCNDLKHLQHGTEFDVCVKICHSQDKIICCDQSESLLLLRTSISAQKPVSFKAETVIIRCLQFDYYDPKFDLAVGIITQDTQFQYNGQNATERDALKRVQLWSSQDMSSVTVAEKLLTIGIN
ncbi:hypothetical protein MIR68_002057 [Amoeboaphelidium protococcarum]|nr:hypothetical protein MIR68_002057 [Amoeboaphelidium protococcarum]